MKQRAITWGILWLPVLVFFWPVLFQGKNPIPADTITGLYHPMRDVVADEYPNGTPYKNFLITDSVRQQYVWREFSIEQLKAGELPWWNPYNFSGTPHIANFQSATFYPLNFLFFLFSFTTAWNILVMLQFVLGAAFMFMYLRWLKLPLIAAIFGSWVWIFSGFFVVWLEWNTAAHVALWAPLILLAIEKLHCLSGKSDTRGLFVWTCILIFSLVSQFYAGYPQPWLYLSLLQGTYALLLLLPPRKQLGRFLVALALSYGSFLLLAAPQLKATLAYSELSNRYADQGNVLEKADWFLPYENLIQIIVPDFLGNPATLNYWGIFNYTEFVGFIGIIPAAMVLASLIRRRGWNRRQIFLVAFLTVALVLATRNPISIWQFKLEIPFISSSQPSRWLVVIDLILAILAAKGLSKVIKNKNSIIIPTFLIIGLMAFLWSMVLAPSLYSLQEWQSQFLITRRNLILPTLELVVLVLSILCLYVANTKIFLKYFSFPKKFHQAPSHLLLLCLIVVSVFSGWRFARKYTPFTESAFLYPSTQTTTYLQNNAGLYRYMSTDQRILAPNINMAYDLYTIEGYDPLYLKSYGQLFTAIETEDLTQSSKAFNRILTTSEFDSPVLDLLGVKYVLSLQDITSDKLTLILQEGETRLYERKSVLPRAFIIPELDITFLDQAIPAEVVEYEPNQVILKTTSNTSSYIVLSDSWYPQWRAYLNGESVDIINWLGIRAIQLPQGNHEIVFKYRHSYL